jgi:hypothetical protein
MVLRATPYSLFTKGLITTLLLFSLHSFGQKLRVNEFDKSTNKWKIETFPVGLKSTGNIKMDISLKSADTSFLIELSGSGIGTNTLDINSELVFLLEGDSTVIVKSPTIQSIDYGELLPTYRHQYSMSLEDLQRLSRHGLKSLRKYSVGGFDDIAIEKKNAGRLKDLSAFYIGELKKGKLIPGKTVSLPAAFPGGNEILLGFLNRNLKPMLAIKPGEKKEMIVQFMVTADGGIDDLHVKQSAEISLDNEILRILKRMPKWKPASVNGKPVSSAVIRPITFYRIDASTKIQFNN